MSARPRPISFIIGPPRGKARSAVQSVVFPRAAWKRAEAVSWLKRKRFKSAPLEAVRGSFRATQHDARGFRRLRTVHTSGHPHPLKNPKGYDPFEALMRDPREQGMIDAREGKPSSPHPWYTPTERGQYAEGYIAGGQGRKGRPAPAERLSQHLKGQHKNPRVGRLVVPERAYHQAIRLFQRFRERDPKLIATMRIELPRMLVQIGPVPFMYYLTTHRSGKEILYKHTFARHARPILAASHDGRALFLLGGKYDFTGDGIVDRPR